MFETTLPYTTQRPRGTIEIRRLLSADSPHQRAANRVCRPSEDQPGASKPHGVDRGVGGVEPWHRGLQGPPTTVGGDQRPDNLTTGAENMSRSADRAAILAGPSQLDLRIPFHRVYRFSSPGCIIPSYGDPSLFVVFSRWPLYFRIVRYQWMVR